MSTGDGIPINKTRTDKDSLETETVQVTVQIFVRQARFPFSAWARLPQSSLSPHLAKSSSCISPESILAWRSVWLTYPQQARISQTSRLVLPRSPKIHPKLRHNPPPIIPQSHASSEALAQHPFLRYRTLYVCDVFRPGISAADWVVMLRVLYNEKGCELLSAAVGCQSLQNGSAPAARIS